MSRIYAILLSVVFSLAVLSPVTECFVSDPSEAVDSFPLSYYPMFRDKRPDLERPRYVVGFDQEGNRHKLDFKFWTLGGMNQARHQLSYMMKTHRRLARVCGDAAGYVAGIDSEPWSSMVQIQILRGLYDLDRYFVEKDTEPLGERVLYWCSVPGREGT